MKRIIASMAVVILLILSSLKVSAGEVLFDVNRANEGIVGIAYPSDEETRYKVLIEKGAEQYNYDYFGTEQEYFPLQSGSGEYTVSLVENISGTSYKVVESKTVNVSTVSETAVYLQSVQNVNWNREMEAIKKAEALTAGLKSTEEKVEAIYQYIITNIKYDFKKMNNLDSRYVPDVEVTYQTGKGICYDYSAIFASMLRSQNIPTKLVKGYTDNVKGYHAWNEVLLNGKWIVVDTTYDAMMKNYHEETTFEKDQLAYQTVRVY